MKLSATLLGDRAPIQLFDLQFELSNEEAAALRTTKDKAVFFTWDYKKQAYQSRIDTRKSKGQISDIDAKDRSKPLEGVEIKAVSAAL